MSTTIPSTATISSSADSGTLSCCIGADGMVRGCPELPPEAEYIAGDVKKDSFAHIWETGFSRFRHRFPADLPARCSDCRDLDLCRGGCAVRGWARDAVHTGSGKRVTFFLLQSNINKYLY